MKRKNKQIVRKSRPAKPKKIKLEKILQSFEILEGNIARAIFGAERGRESAEIAAQSAKDLRDGLLHLKEQALRIMVNLSRHCPAPKKKKGKKWTKR